ncbi:UNVERIFIED_CONTAM: hypothetical protein H355_000174 [Colinus virginianus]|nr:hypothetical protein H355_000174 [Colinus virginianus]
MAEERSLSLLVRSPARRHPDLRLRAAPAWSVRRLKAELRRLAPGAPAEDDQKLIYCGKLLLDHQLLREFLAGEEPHALHLVYNPRAPTDVPGSGTEVNAAQPKLMPEASQEPAAASSGGGRPRCSPGGQESAENSVRPETAQHPSQAVPPGFSAYTTYSILQMSWLQQIYARQYYMQYLASAAASADPSRARRSQEIPVTPPAPLPDPFPAQNQPGNQNAAPQVNVANQNLRMNAQGGPLMEEEEEGGNRDWLDWLYSATLFYVFVNIVYFYSSVSRFLLVMGGTVLMYL